MKKAISLVMCAIMLLCCGSFAGCSSQSSKNSSYSKSPKILAHFDSIVQALREGGFKEAHFILDERSDVYLREDNDKNAIYISLDKDSIYVKDLDNDIDLVKLLDILLKFCSINEENRSQKIVDDMYNKLRINDGSLWVITYDDYDVLFYPNSDETFIEGVTVIPHGSIPNLSDKL